MKTELTHRVDQPGCDDQRRWMRLAHTLALLAAITIAAKQSNDINWIRFVAVFVVIDLVGYVPGALASRRNGGKPIAAIYHHLYNTTHSYLATLVLVAIWAAAINGLEWAMLAIPIHLSGDRALFGNFRRPVGAPFQTPSAPAETATR